MWGEILVLLSSQTTISERYMNKDKKVVDISTKRLRFLNQTGAEQGIATLGDLIKKVCGVDLLKVAVMAKIIEPLLRIEKQNPASFERKEKEYRQLVDTYNETTCLSLINTSKEEEWKHRPIFFALLMEKTLTEKIPGFETK